jgi:hypothetical protein
MSGTIQASVVKDSASATNNLTLDTGGNATVGNTLVMGSSFLRNRIINGDMRIDQRNAGNVVFSAPASYYVDRWQLSSTVSGKFNVGQSNSGYPTGFNSSFYVQNIAGFTPSASDQYRIGQAIEGFNAADLGWGTASAQTVTLSFWAYSSVAGVYAVSLFKADSPFYPTYVSTYTLVASTWTKVTITIPGPTTGTFNTTNTACFVVSFNLGSGSTYATSTLNTWQNVLYLTASSTANWIGTTSATFYVTGVQLEVGSVATPFERRQYGEELMLCQRYYYRISSSGNYTSFGLGITSSTTSALINMPLPVTMRTAPTAADFSAAGNFVIFDGGANSTVTAIVLSYVSTNSISMTGTTGATMTAARPALLEANAASAAYIGVTAEL